MISKELISKLLGKQVHVDFFNKKTGQLEWIEGKFQDVQNDTEEGMAQYTFIEIESDTDLDRICLADVRKIYLK